MSEKNLIRLLYKRLETDLTEDEEQLVSQALLKSSNLRKKNENICRLRKDIRDASRTSFTNDFNKITTAKVFGNTCHENRDIIYYYLFPQFRKIALSAVTAILIITLFNWNQTKDISLESTFNIPEITMENIIELAMFSNGGSSYEY